MGREKEEAFVRPRSVISLGDANFGVRGDEVLLGPTNIRAPLEQRRRHARRHVGRKRLRGERASARHTLREIAKKNADCIFLLANLPLEVRNLRIRCVEHLMGLRHLEPCG
jgi:hypothetical protein